MISSLDVGPRFVSVRLMSSVGVGVNCPDIEQACELLDPIALRPLTWTLVRQLHVCRTWAASLVFLPFL
jgi:hypothetical protein